MLSKKIKVEDIAKYLSDHPDFFIQYPQLLNKLNFPLSKKTNNFEKKVISFKDWLINNLRSEKKGLIENAKHNYLTQKKIHEAVIEIMNKKNTKNFFFFINKKLPDFFKLEIVNLVCTKKELCKKYNLIFLETSSIDKIYKSKGHLVMDAVDNKSPIYNKLDKVINSNAIFSLDLSLLKDFPFLFFGSKDKHFVSHRAYDLILFLSIIIQIKLKELL